MSYKSQLTARPGLSSTVVYFNDTDSGFPHITCGVSQGSHIGQSLFLLYVNDSCKLSTGVTFILFAGDTSCLTECADLSEMCIQLSTAMNKLSTL